jgi:hypothetical protein
MYVWAGVGTYPMELNSVKPVGSAHCLHARNERRTAVRRRRHGRPRVRRELGPTHTEQNLQIGVGLLHSHEFFIICSDIVGVGRSNADCAVFGGGWLIVYVSLRMPMNMHWWAEHGDG